MPRSPGGWGQGGGMLALRGRPWGLRGPRATVSPAPAGPPPSPRPPEPAPRSLRRLCVLLLVCAAQAWLMWRFIHSQLRHWREYWNEQSAKRRVPAAPRLPARLVKRESGECQAPRQVAEVRLGWRGRSRARRLSRDQSCRSSVLPWALALGSCRGLTGTWLGRGQGHVVGEAGPEEAGSPSGHGGWGGSWVGSSGGMRVLEVASERRPRSAACCLCGSVLTCPLVLHLAMAPPPGLLAPLLSSRVTQGGHSARWAAGVGRPLLWPWPRSSDRLAWVPGHCQPCPLCPAWGPGLHQALFSDSPASLQVWPAWQGLLCVWSRHVCGWV